MTEAEWLASTDSLAMLRYLEGKVGHRKCYLFSIECLRRIWQHLADERQRNVVELYAKFVDGLATDEERTAAEVAIEHVENAVGASNSFISDAIHNFICYSGPGAASSIALGASSVIAHARLNGASAESWREVWEATASSEWTAQAHLAHDIFGNPFRPVKVEPAWQTANVVGIAQGIYDQRAFDRMPILADALEEAGCTNANVLNHCRQQGVHGRGCWVVDLLLEKA
jgi:hypothetical protein